MPNGVHPRWYQKVSEKVKTTVQSMASYPLILDKKVIGVVQFLDKVDGGIFTEEDSEILARFAILMA